jgi:histidinol-phosphate aminotransferase
MKIRSVYLEETKSYADHTPEATASILDCSLGVNPYGPPSQALEAIRAFDLGRLGDYPHTHAAHDAIIRYWREFADLTRENILLSDGSVSALYLINSLFANPGAEVVGFMPSFTDMIVNVGMQGMRYTGVAPADADYRENVDAMLATMGADTALVYIDNPNNPTGQLLPKEDLLRVLERAKKLGAYVLIDEAYGDFVNQAESVLCYQSQFDNLIVLRTFSKGFGLAGLRAGYLITTPELTRYMSKTSNPYTMNELTREAAAAAMSAVGYTSSHGDDFARSKRALRENTGHALKLLVTDDRVPICTLKHRETVDLQGLLYNQGILTVSGAEFDCMDESCVRLRVPAAGQTERLIQAVRKVDQPV